MPRQDLEWLTARPIAHRGFHDRAAGRPENTLAAFGAAAERGYAIECDLHLTADGVPVVFHDDDLRRLTGVAGAVRDCPVAELRELRVAGSTEGVPTLDELLALVDGRVPLLLELKSVPGRDAGLAATVVERLRSYRGRAALMSFDTGLIGDVKAADPLLPRGLTAAGGWQSGLAHLNAMRRLGIDFVSYAIDDLPTPAPLFARRFLGMPLICWTVRDPAQRRKAAAWADQITFEGFAA